jgi:hypothetical protein
VEHYADTVKAKGSNPLVITKLRLNSMVEIYYYKVEVVGSIPAVATKLVRSSIGREYPAFTRRVVSSSLTGPTINSDS